MEAIALFPTSLAAVGPPEAVRALGPSPRPADLLAAPRIGTPSEWAQWFDAAGAPVSPAGPPLERLAADNQVLEVAAAQANGAFALASPILFAGEIASGRLVQPFATTMPYGGGYWLVYPHDRRRTRKIAAFRDWLLAQVAADPAVLRFGARP